MKMKKIYIILSFAFCFSIGNAQNESTKRADKLFEQFEFVDAANEYLKIALEKADGYVYKQLGDCYYNVFNATEATKWYAKAVETNQDAETYFRYAQMLKANANYDEANVQMKKFASLAPNDQRTKFITADENFVTKILSLTKLFDVKTVAINTKFSDFGAYLKDNVVYFVSARNTVRKNDNWNDQPFLDIYKSDYTNGVLANTATGFDDLNTLHHEGTMTISSDGNTVYFTRQSFFENEFDKVKNTSNNKNRKVGKNYIYKATKTDGKWGNVTSLSINNVKYNCSAPSITKDGSTLYFSSDMNGSLGKSDIWKVALKTDGTLGTPENLGTNINTEGSEQFPFIADDNTLYFSSNGRNGLGGLDVYAYNNTKNSQPVNIGKPVNSQKDDFGFTFNQAQGVAFLSSNRDGGLGDDDIYQANPICTVDLTVFVKDIKSGSIVNNATVTISDNSGAVLGTATSNNTGTVIFQAECDKDYSVNVEKEGYNAQVFALGKSKGLTTLNAEITPKEAIITDVEIILSDVNFEFNKFNITQDGAFELNKLIEVLDKNPNMVIVTKSHTDSRGNENYNMKLSERRAKATLQYVISKGIARDRITAEGFGETAPKIVCGNDCTEEQHAVNRRSEFLILKK